MTPEQEAMEVWRDAVFAYGGLSIDGEGAEAAASVILAWAEKREAPLREDAERYRWLRDHSCPPHNFYISVPDEFAGVKYKPADVDAYIDRARTLLADHRSAG